MSHNSMNKSDLKKLSKSELIKLLLKKDKKPVPTPRTVKQIRPIPKPRKSVNQIVQPCAIRTQTSEHGYGHKLQIIYSAVLTEHSLRLTLQNDDQHTKRRKLRKLCTHDTIYNLKLTRF